MLVSSEEHLLSYQWKVLALDLLVPGAHGRVGPGELEPVTGTPGEDAFQSGRKFWLTWTLGFVGFTFNFSYDEFLLDGSQVTARVFPVSSDTFSKSFSFGRSLDFYTVPPGPLQEAGWKWWLSHLVPASCPSVLPLQPSRLSACVCSEPFMCICPLASDSLLSCLSWP